MIVFNETQHAIVCAKKFLLPGSNVVSEDEIDLKNPIVAHWIENGDLRIEEKVTEKVAVEAINKANSQSVVDEIESSAPKKDSVKKASSARKKTLDEFDAEVQAEIEKNKKKQQEESEA